MSNTTLLKPENRDYDYIDSFECIVSDPKNKIGIFEVAGIFTGKGPVWIERLLSLRNKIVAVFGLKSTESASRKDTKESNWEIGSQAGIFKVFDKTANEILLGEDDKHLDFRVSLFLEINEGNEKEKKVTATTVVKLHNRLGKCYFFFIKPIHRIIVPILLKKNLKQLEASMNKLT